MRLSGDANPRTSSGFPTDAGRRPDIARPPIHAALSKFTCFAYVANQRDSGAAVVGVTDVLSVRITSASRARGRENPSSMRRSSLPGWLWRPVWRTNTAGTRSSSQPPSMVTR